MANTPSTMLALGTKLPVFELPDFNNKLYSSKDSSGKAVLVMFICNHCPFVRHVAKELSHLSNQFQQRGISVYAISSNDIEKYPADSPENMKLFAQEHDFKFPYLFDETQDIAKSYRAACTLDFYLFNENHKLVYRGQMDDSRPGSDIPVTGNDLLTAVNDLLSGKVISITQKPSIGCNIKWKPGNEPDYFST